MLGVQFKSFGNPVDVAECVELPEPPPPGDGEVVLSVDATPINPSDLLTMSGEYGRLPQLPATPGNEGVGHVLVVGAGVKHLAVGDRVLLPAGGATWRQKLTARADRLVKLPVDGDVLQQSMITANPPTALLMLKMAPLKPGDWVIQNAANSAVGQYLIAFARKQGVKTINIVRREALIEPLKAMGADEVLVDGDGLTRRVRNIVGSGNAPLAIDAIGGLATARLAGCVTPGGTVVNYGNLGGEECLMRPGDLIFRNITLKGFWLVTWFAQASAADVRSVMQSVVEEVGRGTLKAKVEATYPFSRIKEAVVHAAKPGRDGKVILVGK